MNKKAKKTSDQFSPEPVSFSEAKAMLDDLRKNTGLDWKVFLRKRLQVLKNSYIKTENPIYVWEGVLLAYARGGPFPKWILEYLVSSAAGIGNLSGAASEGEKIKPNHIAKVLNMTRPGAGTLFPAKNDYDWVLLGFDVKDRIENGDQETYAIADVAKEYKLSEASVRRAYKRHQDELPKIPKN